MLLGDTPVPVDAWVQYGCFGLLAALVVWSLWKGIPGALQTHKEAVEKQCLTIEKVVMDHKSTVDSLVLSYEKEADQCRQERLEVARQAAVEREADRKTRQELSTAIQKIMDQTSGR